LLAFIDIEHENSLEVLRMKRLASLTLFILLLVASTPSQAASDKALDYDEGSARDVLVVMSKMGEWSTSQGKVIFLWKNDWDGATRIQRLGLIQAFANSDACITGKARDIEFFRNGKRVGEASPSKGIRLVN